MEEFEAYVQKRNSEIDKDDVLKEFQEIDKNHDNFI